MNYYFNIGLKILASLGLIFFIFVLIVLCVDEKKLKIKNTNRRKINENIKKRNMNNVSKNLVNYGKILGNKFSIKKKNK